MKLHSTSISGCFEIIPDIQRDERGHFVKTFNSDLYQDKGLEVRFLEEYYTVSNKGVLRGLHFQVPPKHQAKQVYSVFGDVFDAVVDLRIGSPSYGKFQTFILSPEKGNIVYIPPGLAHGFYVISERAILIYNVSTVYSPKFDSGILWNSVNIPWPSMTPIVSKRDKEFLSFSEFKSPFFYER